MKAMEEYHLQVPVGQEPAFLYEFTDDIYAMAATAVSVY
jgi:hypothetical protein